MLSEYVKTEDLLTHCQSPAVWSATTEPLQGQRQTISVMIVFTRMVQQHGCARMMVWQYTTVHFRSRTRWYRTNRSGIFYVKNDAHIFNDHHCISCCFFFHVLKFLRLVSTKSYFNSETFPIYSN